MQPKKFTKCKALTLLHYLHPNDFAKNPDFIVLPFTFFDYYTP